MVQDIYDADISIHAPAKGATDKRHDHTPSSKYFNPRSRKGSDRIYRAIFSKDFTISIHAPAKGATHGGLHGLAGSIYFNPRSRKGSDFWEVMPCVTSSNFNPRSRKGSDE